MLYLKIIVAQGCIYREKMQSSPRSRPVSHSVSQGGFTLNGSLQFRAVTSVL